MFVYCLIDTLISFIFFQAVVLYSRPYTGEVTEGMQVPRLTSVSVNNCLKENDVNAVCFFKSRTILIPKEMKNVVFFSEVKIIMKPVSISCRHLKVFPQWVLLEKRCDSCQHSED